MNLSASNGNSIVDVDLENEVGTMIDEVEFVIANRTNVIRLIDRAYRGSSCASVGIARARAKEVFNPLSGRVLLPMGHMTI